MKLQLFLGYLTVERVLLLLALLVQPLRHVFEVLDSTLAHKAPFSKHFTGSKQRTHTHALKAIVPLSSTYTYMQIPPCRFLKMKFWQADKIFYSTLAIFIYLYEPKACTERTILKLIHTHTHTHLFSVMLIEFAHIQAYIAIHIHMYIYAYIY